MSEKIYIGKLGPAILSAPTPVIVGFADGQTLDFATIEDACGFLAFYNQSRTARTQNMANIYILEDGNWKAKHVNFGGASAPTQPGR